MQLSTLKMITCIHDEGVSPLLLRAIVRLLSHSFCWYGFGLIQWFFSFCQRLSGELNYLCEVGLCNHKDICTLSFCPQSSQIVDKWRFPVLQTKWSLHVSLSPQLFATNSPFVFTYECIHAVQGRITGPVLNVGWSPWARPHQTWECQVPFQQSACSLRQWPTTWKCVLGKRCTGVPP